jgi:hypothetical protein
MKRNGKKVKGNKKEGKIRKEVRRNGMQKKTRCERKN